MENAIKFLRIQNFKSIKDVTLHPRRVNLIIGEPNVGKSNLLEAMTLLGGITYEQTEKFMGSFIRYEEPRQLFYDNLVGNTIKVETDKDVAVLLFEKEAKLFQYLFCDIAFYEEVGVPLRLPGPWPPAPAPTAAIASTSTPRSPTTTSWCWSPPAAPGFLKRPKPPGSAWLTSGCPPPCPDSSTW